MSDELPVVWMPGGVRTEIHLGDEETAGALCMLVDEPPAGWSLPPHRHANEAETIHVVEGEFEIDVDGCRFRLSPGQSVHVEKGVVHSGANVGAGTGRRIVVFNPAGIEKFFLEAGSTSAAVEPDAAAALESAARYGWEFRPPTR